jgi:hypothetical protein
VRLRSQIVQKPLRSLGVGAGVLALAASGLFGGLQEARGPAVPVVAADTVDRGLPWNVTVHDAQLVSELPPLKPDKEGDHWLAVRATVEITADATRTDIGEALRLPSVTGLRTERPDSMYLLRDDTIVGGLHPGMPEKVAFLWQRAGGAPAPAELEIEIIGKTLRHDSLTGHLSWLDHEPRTLVRVALRDRRAP